MNYEFSFRRFWLVAKWDVIANWRSSAKITLGMAFGLLMMYGTVMFNLRNIPPEHLYMHSSLLQMAMLTNLCFAVFMSVGASRVFGNMKTRQQRTAFIMLPASAAEKFAVRWLYATAGYALMFLAASVVADVLRGLFCLIAAPRMGGSVMLTAARFFRDDMFPSVYTGIADVDTPTVIIGFLYILMCMLVVHSFYVLGGALFRRNAWVLTTGAGVLLMFVAIGTGATDLFVWEGWHDADDKFRFVLTPLLLLCALTLFLYWCAWRVFRRTQLAGGKWINL